MDTRPSTQGVQVRARERRGSEINVFERVDSSVGRRVAETSNTQKKLTLDQANNRGIYELQREKELHSRGCSYDGRLGSAVCLFNEELENGDNGRMEGKAAGEGWQISVFICHGKKQKPMPKTDESKRRHMQISRQM